MESDPCLNIGFDTCQPSTSISTFLGLLSHLKWDITSLSPPEVCCEDEEQAALARVGLHKLSPNPIATAIRGVMIYPLAPQLHHLKSEGLNKL